MYPYTHKTGDKFVTGRVAGIPTGRSEIPKSGCGNINSGDSFTQKAVYQ